MAVNNEITREGFENLQAELEELKSVKLKENSESIKEALSYGDLSENAEYSAAKEEQGRIQSRIEQLEELIRTVKVVDESSYNVDTVQTGVRVTIKDLDMNEVFTYKIVGSAESDPLQGKLSNASLVGQHLMGLKPGEKVEFSVPDGIARYEVLEVTR